MSVKCVLKCMGKTEPTYAGGPVQVSLEAVYQDDAGNRLHHDFATATPSAQFSLWIDNPPAAERFVPGRFYDVTLTARE